MAALWIVACDYPLRPELCGSVPEQTIVVGETVTVDLCFDDPDGEMLDFEVFTSDPGVATAVATGSVVTVTAISPGIVLLTMVATDPTGLKAQQSFRVVVPNRPPAAVGMIGNRELTVGDSAVINVAGYFSEPDGQALSYAAVVSDSSRLAVSVGGTVVTVVGVAKGMVAVTVTATDPGGLTAIQSFQVKVPNRPPVPVDSIAAREIMVDRADTLGMSPFFSDPDEDPLTYVAAVSDSALVAVSVSDSTVTVTGLAKGEAVVTVTATDDEGLSATQRFMVTVPNRPPVVTGTIPAQTLFKDEADTLKLAAHFTDPDGDAIAWSAEASDNNVLALGLSATDGTLTVTARSQGEAVVTVTATDTEGLTAQQGFAVTVPNRGPVATDTIPAQTLYKRETAPLDLTRYFNDPDGDALEYAIESTNTLVATAAVTGNRLTVQAGVKGEAILTVTTTDPGGLAARQGFAVTVLNRAPIVTTPIQEQTIFRGLPHMVDLATHFDDPAGDTLSYSAESSDRWVVRVQTHGSSVALTAQRKGTADVTVTATDPDSLTVHQTFVVIVGNQGPVPVGQFADLELARNDRLTLPINRYFGDPDRDALEYAASTSDPGIARATTRGSDLTLTGVSDGQTTLTLTATDPGGLTATQTSQITVAGQDGNTPEPVGEIPEQTVAERRDRTLVVSGYFQDPNGDPLTYSATTEDPNVATASASGTSVTLTAVASGQTTLTVTATDPDGLTAEQQFGVRVFERSPVSPDLQVASPMVSDSGPAAGMPFTLSATVHNAGDGAAAATTLRYYRSPDATNTASDAAEGTDVVRSLAASATSRESITLAAPAGTYYYGACVDVVAGESDTTNNCSAAVKVTVSPSPNGGGQPATEVHLFRPESVEEHVGDATIVVVAWTKGNLAPTESIPVRVWLVAGTADEGVDFGRFDQSIEFNPADFRVNNSRHEAVKELTITILVDAEAEGDETFGATMTLERARPFVTLMSPDSPEQLIITILANDDPN